MTRDVTRIALNDQFIFEIGTLDQGFWPDGIYTAPTDAALRSDIEFLKQAGFNLTRKHVKVEPDAMVLLVRQTGTCWSGRTCPAATTPPPLARQRI